MITLLVLVLLFVVLGALAFRFGADSRDGRDWSVPTGPRSSRATLWSGGWKAEEESDAAVASATTTTLQTPLHSAA